MRMHLVNLCIWSDSFNPTAFYSRTFFFCVKNSKLEGCFCWWFSGRATVVSLLNKLASFCDVFSIPASWYTCILGSIRFLVSRSLAVVRMPLLDVLLLFSRRLKYLQNSEPLRNELMFITIYGIWSGHSDGH